MPFKSRAQQKFMFAAESRGELPKGTAERWAHHTNNIKALPEHVAHKKASSVMQDVLAGLQMLGLAPQPVKQANELTTTERAHLPKKDFARPGRGKTKPGSYPMPNKAHARAAIGFCHMHHSPGYCSDVDAKAHHVLGKSGAALPLSVQLARLAGVI